MEEDTEGMLRRLRRRKEQAFWGKTRRVRLFLATRPESGLLLVQWQVARFLEFKVVQTIFLMAIVANGVMIGIVTDYEEYNIKWVEDFFTVFFLVEICAKVVGYGTYFVDDPWNIFDMVIVASSVILLFLQSMNELTVLRLFRVFRLLRIVGRINKLNRLMEAFVKALNSVLWVGLLMILFLYIFGVLACVLFGKDEALMEAVPGAYTWFGTVPRSMASLFQVMTMDSWSSQISRPLGEVQPWVWPFMTIFLFLVGLGLLNLLSAIFVDSLLDVNTTEAKEDVENRKNLERVLQQNLQQLFLKIDIDRSGTLTHGEVEEAIDTIESDPKWIPHLQALGVTKDELVVLLHRLEWDDCHGREIFYDDFLALFNRLEAEASKEDVWRCEALLRLLHRRLDALFSTAKPLEEQLEESLVPPAPPPTPLVESAASRLQQSAAKLGKDDEELIELRLAQTGLKGRLTLLEEKMDAQHAATQQKLGQVMDGLATLQKIIQNQ